MKIIGVCVLNHGAIYLDYYNYHFTLIDSIFQITVGWSLSICLLAKNNHMMVFQLSNTLLTTRK